MKMEKIRKQLDINEAKIREIDKQIEYLHKEVESEDNFILKMELINEMVDLANELSNLDSQNKKLLLKLVKKTRRQLFKDFIFRKE